MTIASVNAQAKLTEQSKVSIYGIGSVSVGMTIAEASSAAGTPLIKTPSYGAAVPGCLYYTPQGGPEEVSFMAINGRIARVDVLNKRITTVSGAKIGDTMDRIYSLYPGQIKITDIRSGGRERYFEFVPTSVQDKNYRLLFGTIQGSVHFFIAGKLPEVEYTEGCI